MKTRRPAKGFFRDKKYRDKNGKPKVRPIASKNFHQAPRKVYVKYHTGTALENRLAGAFRSQDYYVFVRRNYCDVLAVKGKLAYLLECKDYKLNHKQQMSAVRELNRNEKFAREILEEHGLHPEKLLKILVAKSFAYQSKGILQYTPEAIEQHIKGKSVRRKRKKKAPKVEKGELTKARLPPSLKKEQAKYDVDISKFHPDFLKRAHVNVCKYCGRRFPTDIPNQRVCPECFTSSAKSYFETQEKVRRKRKKNAPKKTAETVPKEQFIILRSAGGIYNPDIVEKGELINEDKHGYYVLIRSSGYGNPVGEKKYYPKQYWEKVGSYGLFCEGELVDVFPSEKAAWDYVDSSERLQGRSGTEEPLLNYAVKKIDK